MIHLAPKWAMHSMLAIFNLIEVQIKLFPKGTKNRIIIMKYFTSSGLVFAFVLDRPIFGNCLRSKNSEKFLLQMFSNLSIGKELITSNGICPNRRKFLSKKSRNTPLWLTLDEKEMTEKG